METLDSQLVAPLSPTLKQRNAFFDALFYDVGALTDEEKEALSPLMEREGSVIWVPPSSSGRNIEHFAEVDEFLKQQVDRLQAVVVAGVGSSLLGTAALARNVANVYGIDVAGVGFGYGASDLVSEAMGGWFFYGATDMVRHELRETVNRMDPIPTDVDTLMHQPVPWRTTPSDAPLPKSTDVMALDAILDAEPARLTMLVGHGKGDLLMDYALERFVNKQEGRNHPYFEKLHIVTFGAVTELPPEFKNVHQFIGDIDWFGGMNSRFDLPHQKVPNAWHHLNTSLPFHLSAESVLREHVPFQQHLL